MYRYYDQNSSVGLNSLYIINEDKKYNRFALNMMDLPVQNMNILLLYRIAPFIRMALLTLHKATVMPLW